MNDNINDFLDSITQQELEQWEQIDLIDMEDKLAQKRIQKLVKKKLHPKKYSKKSVVAAALVCILGITAMSTEAVQAALERVFHFIPNIGVVESDVVYDVEIICGKLEKENVTIELTDCYVKEHFLLGTICITDTTPYIYEEKPFAEEHHFVTKKIQDKYNATWYHDDEEKEVYFNTSKTTLRDNFKKVERNIHQIIDKSENNYYEIGIDGFEQRLSFRLKETKVIPNLKGIGKTVTKNGTSITATAEMTEQGAKIDYYAICSEEAQTTKPFEEDNIEYLLSNIMPYFESIPNAVYKYYLKTKSGKFAEIVSSKTFKENGGEVIFDATKKDFPATFYYTSLSAKTDEFYYCDLPIPEIGQTIPLDISAPFEYGTVKILSVSRIQEIDYTGLYRPDENGRMIAQKGLIDKVTVNVNIEPKKGKRMLYNVRIRDNSGAGSYGDITETTQNENTFDRTITFSYLAGDLEEEKNIKLQLDKPIYWIVGEYAIPVKLK